MVPLFTWLSELITALGVAVIPILGISPYKIEQGSITFEQATEIFNRAHEIVIQSATSERERNGPKL